MRFLTVELNVILIQKLNVSNRGNGNISHKCCKMANNECSESNVMNNLYNKLCISLKILL